MNPIASERDVWKRKNWYYWEDLENFCCLLIPENARVLEVGCGTGDLIASLKTKNRVGIDYSSGMIEIARKKYPDIDFSCMEAEDLTFDEPFDYIILSNTIGYLEDIQGVFAGLMKVCHQHTKVIVTYYTFFCGNRC